MAKAKQQQIPAPVDRPLQKAYLKKFTGWSTAHPPGLSDPTSLRKMENVLVHRDGGAGPRPGMRSIFPDDTFAPYPIVGSFEHFFTNEGDKAILFAEDHGHLGVEFRAAVYNSTTHKYELTTLDALGFTISGTLPFTANTTYVRYLQIDNKILALSDKGEPMRVFYVGDDKRASVVQGVEFPRWQGDDMLQVVHPGQAWINNHTKDTVPTKQAAGADTLVSSDDTKNQYNYGYFYTFFNELGESAPSMIRLVKAQRGYSFWKMVAPGSNGAPGNAAVSDARVAADQLVAYIPAESWNGARAQGAKGWNLYAFTWSDQAPVPTDAYLVGTRVFEPTSIWETDGWIAHLPMIQGSDITVPLPSHETRVNYTSPPKASQGLVVGDRVVLVYDRENSARIYWSSNLQGEYLNFSASKGGGYKTLTSGNLYIPASVKLWQNPQSVDTITILCTGVDGFSTSYYMSPNTTVAGNTLGTLIMGFEETTATPGTVSPFGVEVLNNALYHPLDLELMKSTAANYNINHASMTEDIQNKWQYLRSKENIISSQLDNRLYYIVNNPDGPAPETGYAGNEIWVCDTAMEGVWNRWLVPGIALRKIELDGYVYMAVVQKDGIFVFDELLEYDERKQGSYTVHKSIPWYMETNTQGANKSHDAWARLQQVQTMFGTFYGTVQYGVKGWDVHGRPVKVEKIFRNLDPLDIRSRPIASDIEDYLLSRVDLKEWYFFIGSVEDTLGQVQPSYGQLNSVTYRFAPTTVNVGYEYGSIETFEYTRAITNWADRTTDNGVPIPVIDTRRP